MTDGTVIIRESDGTQRIFQPDSRPGGGYFPMEGDYATLTNLGEGVFTLRETTGFIRAFHPDGRLDYVEDTNGNRITAHYTGDLLTSLSHSAGQMLQITYNNADLIEAITDQDSRQTAFNYDTENEHLLSATYFDGSTVAYEYITGEASTRNHALMQIEYPGNTHQYFSYDSSGRLASVDRDDNTENITFSYDSAGMIAVSDAFNNISRYYLDQNGLLVKTTDPQGDSVTSDYDENFNLIRMSDPIGHSHEYEYDNAGNLIYTTDPLGNSTRFEYTGPFDRLTKLLDAKGNVTKYGYDDNGNLTAITYDDDSVDTWSYNPEGTPESWTNRRNNTIHYEYNASGRITEKIFPDTSRIDYVYNERGNLVSATDDMGTITLDYDSDDRLEKINYPGSRFLEYTYNAAGQRASMLNQLGHRLDYHYDSAGRLESITDETDAEIVQYLYDAAGRLEQKNLGNGAYTIYEYDTASQLDSLTNYKPDNTILSQFIYTYDHRGWRTSMTATYGDGDPRLNGTWDYEYDEIGQLVTWTAPDGHHVEYTYDALGNRIAVTDNGTATSYTTNNLNQYTQVGDTTYTYDSDGNLSQKVSPEDTTTYTFNDENRLVAIASNDENWSYTYDAFGNRVQVDDNGVLNAFVIDPIGYGNVVGEYNYDNGDLVAQYDHGFGLLSLTDATGNFGFFTFEGIGNTREITGSNGTMLNTYDYLPFGKVLTETETIENTSEYIGQYGVNSDNNGLHYMRERYFESILGRFISADPIGIAGGINLYGYVNNRVVSSVDPMGTFPFDWIDAVDPRYSHTKGYLSPAQYPIGPKTNLRTNGLKYNHNLIGANYTACMPCTQSEISHQLTALPFFEPMMPEILPTDCCNSEYSPEGYGRPTHHDGTAVFRNLNLPVPPTQDGPRKKTVPVRSTDPNEKIGSNGFGDQGFIAEDNLLSYRISFENYEDATAPAQIVTIEDQLDTNLDWMTFELTEIGFGDERIAVPENTRHFETTIPMTYNGVSFEVQIEAGVRLTTGEVYAYFYSIDPITGLPPAVDIGFLPPEDGTGRGQGYFTYTIKPKFGLSEGTEIRNIALITFDYQETIATNQVDPHDASKGTDPDKEVLVTIAPDQVNLTAVNSDGGSVANPGPGTFGYDWSATISINANADNGYRFKKWTGNTESIEDIYAADTTITMYDHFSIAPEFEAAGDPEINGCYLGAYLGCGPEDMSCESPSAFNQRMGTHHAIFIRYVDIKDSNNPVHWEWAKTVAKPMFIYDPYDGLDQIDMADVETFANQCKDLNRTIFIVFGHEMNAPWYPWGNQPESFKAKYREVAEVFHQIAPKVKMCWVPHQNWGYPWGGDDFGDGYTEYYPEGTGTYGDYVDWVGLNFYDRDYDEDNLVSSTMFIANIRDGQDDLDFYETFAIGKGKPMLISETAAFDPNIDPSDIGTRIPLTLEEQDAFKGAWISHVYDVPTLKGEFPWLNAICYFSVEKQEAASSQSHDFGEIVIDYRIPEESIYSLLIDDPYFLTLLPGDVNADDVVDLADAILSLQLSVNIGTASGIFSGADANDDGRINIVESIYILQQIAGSQVP